MVIYRGADGKPGYHQTDDIHDAVMYVESLRNEKDVDHARIFRLEEVTFEYKPYYRVELKVGSAAVSSGNGESEAADRSDDDEVLDTTEVSDHDTDGDGDEADEATDEASDEGSASGEDSDDVDDDMEESTASGARRGLFGR
jgi:hypothetical protein